MGIEDKLHWEDFVAGETLAYGDQRVTQASIDAYAREFGLAPNVAVANGWQVCGWCMRMMVDNFLRRTTSMGSPGIDRLRWLLPVRVGDCLSMHQQTLNKARHPRRRNIGFVNSRFEVYNQRNERVLWMESGGMFLVRHPEAGA